MITKCQCKRKEEITYEIRGHGLKLMTILYKCKKCNRKHQIIVDFEKQETEIKEVPKPDYIG